jgi:uncharacterized protein YndB with AHSA1/START domain
MARFEDRWTVSYVRMLPASVARVWEAVTHADQLNLWFIPVVTLEARPGGRCSFSWGGAESEAEPWTVTRFESPGRAGSAGAAVFELAAEPDRFQYLRFELYPHDAATRLTFTNRFDCEMREDDLALAKAHPDNKLLALPAGPDTPIRAGILEGYHLMMDGLAPFLARSWAPGELAAESAAVVARVNAEQRVRFEGADQPPSPLAERYYDWIRDCCPPAPDS